MKLPEFHPLLIDITLHDRFIHQVRYTKRGWPMKLEGGGIMEVHNMEDIRAFIESLYPSLKGKDYHIDFTNQKVF